jgi:D-alanine-D-alanine ligase
MTSQRKIGVLMGGLSAERDVSMRSGEAIVAALTDRGYDAWPLFVDRDVDLVLRQARIDVAFLLHGRYGEDGCVQGMLELLGIPYTGSGVLASALAMNKAKAKEVFRLNNLPTAPGYLVEADGGEDLQELHGAFGFPAVVKPCGEGSSFGTRVARDELELEIAVEDALRFDDDVLVERFVDGGDLRGVLDGKPTAVEIVPSAASPISQQVRGGRTDTTCPRGCRRTLRSVLRLATLAHEALGYEGRRGVDL